MHDIWGWFRNNPRGTAHGSNSRRVQPFLAYRAWRIDPAGPSLVSCTCDYVWPSRTRADASCNVTAGTHLDAPPIWECTCGFYAYKTEEALTASQYARSPRMPTVSGRVALWGRVIDHEIGYRAAYAYPQLLFLRCDGTDDLIRRVADRYAVECVPRPQNATST